MLALTTGGCEPMPRDEQSAPARDSAGVTEIANFEPDEQVTAIDASRETGAVVNPQIPTSSGFHEFRDCPECPLMVELPPGEFVMGRGAHERPDPGNPPQPEWMVEAQKPPTEVRIAYSFAIGKYEVTFGEWDLCIDAGGCTYVPDDNGWGRGDRPVINLAHPDVDQYVTWISGLTGQTYRLPSEAEWEYAARGGTTTTRYWGDGPGAGMVTCEGCPGRSDNHTTPAGSFPANPFGLHDVIGNAREWVADCWNDTHEGNPGDGSARVEESPWWQDGTCIRGNSGAADLPPIPPQRAALCRLPQAPSASPRRRDFIMLPSYRLSLY